MERTAMSSKEFIRGSVLARVREGEITLIGAIPLLGVSYRQAKRLYRRYRKDGANGLVHGNVGRRSNRAHAIAERDAVLSIIRADYGGSTAKGSCQRFGPTLVAEHLWTDHGILVPRQTLRDWMREAGLWSRVRRVIPVTHERRERKAHFGELVQMDGSFHDWFEGRGARQGHRSCMMSLVDDATSITLLRFGDEETIWAAAGALLAWIKAYGVPRALYTDWKNVYKREPTTNERARGEVPYTQFGRMCQKLGIELIAASSPQAKGRVERNHGTQQDRLVKKMRLLKLSDDAQANAYVMSDYLPKHNARFAVQPASAVDHHREWDRTLHMDDVFCLEHTRVIGNDFVVQYNNRGLQFERAARGRVPAKSRVLVRETEDGRLRVIYVARDGRERVCSWTQAAARSSTSPTQLTRVQRDALDPTGSQLIPSIPSMPSIPPTRSAGRGSGTTPNRPGPDHPWRRDSECKQYQERRQELARLRLAAADVHP